MAHHDQDQLPSIDLESLDMITGGVTTRSSSTNDPNGQLTTALQSITSSIASLKNNNNQSSFSQLLPMLALSGGLGGKGGACPCGCGMANCVRR